MKLKELLLESPTDIVARFYKEAGDRFDSQYNPEDAKYKKQAQAYYDENFKEWFAEQIVPVFTKPIDKPQPPYTVTPKDGKLQSPGYRGLQHAKAAAGLPYNHDVQRYTPNASKMLAPKTMDATLNNNGQ
jgi:hypothetical protein